MPGVEVLTFWANCSCC